MTRGSFAANMKDLITQTYDADIKMHETVYDKIFKEVKSTDMYEDYKNDVGLGSAVRIDEGANVTYDAGRQFNRHQLTNITYGLGIQVTDEMIKDLRAIPLINNKASQFAKAELDVKEKLAANILNRAFNGAYAWADGKELCATNHPSDAGDISNELSTPADLSEATLEQYIIDGKKQVDFRGVRRNLQLRKMVLPVEQIHNYRRITKSEARVATADNDANALMLGGYFQDDAIFSPYLTDSNASFVLTSDNDLAGNGLIYQNRQGAEFSEDKRFDSDILAMKMKFRCAFGANSFFAIMGSPGAS